MTLLKRAKKIKLPAGRLEELRKQVNSWTSINFYLTSWTLTEVEKAIYLETVGLNRPRVLKRLLSRKNTLQSQQDAGDVGV